MSVTSLFILQFTSAPVNTSCTAQLFTRLIIRMCAADALNIEMQGYVAGDRSVHLTTVIEWRTREAWTICQAVRALRPHHPVSHRALPASPGMRCVDGARDICAFDTRRLGLMPTEVDSAPR